MLKEGIIFIGVAELMIGIISSLFVSRKLKSDKNSEKRGNINNSNKKTKVNINELMSLEGVTYIFLASVAINTNMDNKIVITLFMIIQVVFFSVLLKEIKRK